MPRRCAAPTVVTIHDLTFFTNPDWHERSKVLFFRRAISYSAAHARVLVCVSEFTARQLDEVVPVHAHVVVAPLGVDLEACLLYTSVRRRRQRPRGVALALIGRRPPRTLGHRNKSSFAERTMSLLIDPSPK